MFIQLRPETDPGFIDGSPCRMISPKRAAFFTIALLVSFFVVFLGVRNQYLNTGKGPKQRPRAVIEQTEDSPEKNFFKQTVDLEHQTSTPFLAARRVSSLVPPVLPKYFQFIIVSRLSARAPPIA